MRAPEPPTATPVAVIGLACRLPGADGPDGLWRLLCAGEDAIVEVPPSRYDIDAYHDPRPGTPGRIVTRRGGFLDRIDEFDAGFFGVAPREVEEMDPQQRLLLETAAEAIDDAGLGPDELARSRTGVFVGAMANTYWEMLSRAGVLDVYAATGGARAMLSGRLSYAFDLRGPSATVDTACSSSLVALHLAYQSVRSGESALALAGGVNLLLSAQESIPFSQARMLSPDGRCKFASRHGDGFVRSEGVVVVVLKSLAQAESDGDRIHGVIYGSAVGNDGGMGLLMAPSQHGQEETLRAAYANAGVDPATVDYVEAHGTGTPAGDPVELRALAAVLGADRPSDRPCVVGSVKTNIGHTEAAAGLAGFVKALLCLRHRQIPASLHARELTEAVDWATLPIAVAQQARPWPETGRPGLAGVSSFGISGTNAHVVVGEYRPLVVAEPEAEPDTPHLLVLSAPDPAGLAALAARFADYLEPGGGGHRLPLRDICHSAAVRRQHRECRLTAVGDAAGIAEHLRAYVAGESRPRMGAIDETGSRPRVVFVYPGQGSQWDGMGRELLDRSPVFRQIIADCDRVIAGEAGWSLIDRLTGVDTSPATLDTVQPMLWAMETALSGLLESWGIQPDLIVGHSMGEVAAATVSGALSLSDAGAVICRRSRLARRLAGQGAMVSVELSVEDAEAALAGYADRVSVAVSNSPTSTVLSGDPAALEQITQALDARGVFCRPVNVDFASHSPQMDLLREELVTELAGLSPRAGRVPIYSTVDSALRDGTGLDAAYWARNLREPVRFAAAVTHLAAEAPVVFVEISPHPILLPAIGEILATADAGSAAIGCLRRDEPELASMLDAVAGLHRAGCPIDWDRVFGDPPPRYVAMPAYPWQRRRYWFGPATPAVEGPAPRPVAPPAGHPLVGRLSSAGGGGQGWQGRLDPAIHPYLGDHRVQGIVVLPGTAYLEMAQAAARQVVADGALVLSDVRYEAALFFRPDRPATEVAIRLTPAGPDQWTCEVTSRDGADAADGWTRHAVMTVDAVGDLLGGDHAVALDLAAIRAACPDHVDGATFYGRSAAQGNGWLGQFQGIVELWRGATQALGRIASPGPLDQAGYHCHPAVLDACGQVLASMIPDGAGAGAFVLGGIDEVRIHRSVVRPAFSHVRVTPSWRSDSFTGDIAVADADGAVLLEIVGLRLQFLQPASSVRDHRPWLHALRWPVAPALPPTGATATGPWLVFADRGGVAAALAAAWEADGIRSILVTAGDAYRPIGPDRYEIDPAAPADYHRLLDPDGPDGGAYAGVLHLWSLTDESTVDHSSVLLLVRALSAPGAPRLWLVTRGVHRIVDTDRTVAVGQAPVWGLGRTISREHPALRCTLLDLDAAGPAAAAAGPLRRELAAGDTEDQIALRGSERHVARLMAVDPSLGSSVPDPTTIGYELRTDTPGLLDGLGLVPVARPAPGPGEVEVRADHLALNYRDVLLALDHYPSLDPEVAPTFLGECAGVVTRVGAGVAGLHPGDEIVAIAPARAGTHLRVNAHLGRARPAGLSAPAAATLPIAYLTAYHSLCGLAGLREGERVLIHHATGGVGLAAIQIARWKGAEVYATAGTPQKRALLAAMGIRHIADSRGVEFADQFLAATRGEGMDVVLNTLSGEGLEKSLAVLAPQGRYVELSRRDLVDGTRLDLRFLARGISFFVVDVVDLCTRQPREAGAILDDVLRLVGAGLLAPLPHQVYPAAELADAFRQLMMARHIGKVLVSVSELTAPDGSSAAPDDSSTPPVAPAAPTVSAVPARRPVRVVADASYLVTGGLGELGRVVVDWLVREGARCLLLTGRSVLSGEAAHWLSELRRHGVRVEYEPVDVADEGAMVALLDRRAAQGAPPLRGVVHAAGAIHYRALSDLDPAGLAELLHPKLTGGWVLQRLLAGSELDFFVLFSSASAILGSPLLGAYAAANAGLDALAEHLRLAGVPALSVNWGFWSVGMPARAALDQGRSITPQGMDTFAPREGIEALRTLLAADATHAVVLAVDWQRWRAAYPYEADAPLLRSVLAPDRLGVVSPVLPGPIPTRRPDPAPSALAPPLPPALAPSALAPPLPAAAASAAETGGSASPLADRAAAEDYLRRVVADVLGLAAANVHARRPLKRQGLDSLMAIQVRSRVQKDLGLMLPIAKLLDGRSISDLVAELTNPVPP